MASRGGRRVGSGRKPRDTVRVECSIPRSIYDELLREEGESGIYHTRIAARVLSEYAAGRMVRRELDPQVSAVSRGSTADLISGIVRRVWGESQLRPGANGALLALAPPAHQSII
jgi:hypothetical protein